MLARKPQVAVVGDGTIPLDHPKARLAEELGGRIVESGFRLVTGGMGGVMEAASRGARSSPAHRDGDVIGIVPTSDPRAANPFVDVVLSTGLGHARNVLVAHADALIAIGGGAGTLAEIAFAWILDRLVIALRVDGWSGELADRRLDARVRFAHVADDRVHGASTVDEAVALLVSRLPDSLR